MFKIVVGGAVNIPVKFRDSNDNPIDLTSATDISTCFQNTDGTEVMLSLLGGGIALVGNPLLGQIQVLLSAANTALLSTSDVGTLEVTITIGGAPTKVQLVNAYEVVASVC